MAAKMGDESNMSNANGSTESATDSKTQAAATNGNLSDAEDSEDDKDDTLAAEGGAAPSKKKKKKKPKKKKSKATSQSNPPRVLVSQLFPNDSYPPGEEVDYTGSQQYRTLSTEKRHLDRMRADFMTEYRQGAEVHRQVRQWAQRELIKPGRSLTEIAEGIEDAVRALTGHPGLEEGDGIKGGMGFPTGLNINHIAAHYSPNAGNKTILGENDVMKVDIGVHINGRIVDSAFTVAFNPQYDNLLTAVKEATNTGVQEAGIDVRVCDIGAAIQETMESYECTIDGKTYPIKSIRNLNGHDIVQYSIHGGKSVPIVGSSKDQTKMEENETFAIETFGSTGKGYVVEDLETSHYAKRADAQNVALRVSSARSLLNVINRSFGTIPFCRRYLDRLGQEKYLLGLNNLVQAGIVEAYPPLVDIKGSYTAQFEHTILLRPNCKEVISRGDDY